MSKVNAEIHAVEMIRDGIARFAQHARTAMQHANAAAQTAVRHAEAEASSRRQALDRARQSSAQAEAALARCREGCGGLAQAVARAHQVEGQAQAAHDRACQAVSQAQHAAAKLSSRLLAAEAQIERHAGPAVGSCNELVSKLKAYLSHGTTASNLLTAAQIAVAMSQAGMQIDTLSKPYVAPPSKEAAIVEMANDRQADLASQWGDWMDIMRDRRIDPIPDD